MNLEILKKELEDYPDYRLNQAKEAVYSNLIKDWSEATNLPKELRENLSKEISLKIKADLISSKDKKTNKTKIILSDNLRIESVLMDYDEFSTVCISTQVGCALGCQFCATGNIGFFRDLTVSEILNQLLFFKRKFRDKKIKNIVFMGMGEPFLNYQNLMEAIKVINHPKYFNIGARNISISTVGIPEGIKKLSKENLQLNLAISLHFSSNEKRSKFMPINKKYNIENVLRAVDYYIKETNRKVMFEYLLLEDINDTKKDALELAKMLKNRLHHLNLIEYNQTTNLKGSSNKKIEEFRKILQNAKINVTRRKSFGKEIDGGCGQLIAKNE